MGVKNQSREAEQQRVDTVILEIKAKEEELHTKASGLKESVINLRKNFWEDVTVNLDEPDDVIETQASIKQQAELLSERERFHGKIGGELKTLKRLENSPYFGRIDFLEAGQTESEPIYIGVASLMDKHDENFLVYDWRAPISSLYYDFSPGKAKYETIEGTIAGEMTLKRQFIIRNGLLKGMFDTGITIGDQLLQQALGNNASTSMKSIVATIQREQNKIIRDEKSKCLIVQGVAGSGKTSAALQRVAYLMYRYRETLHAENIVLLSPNPLFSSYVSNVLPELGEANIRQITFQEYLEAKMTDKLVVESPFQQMEYSLTEENDEACTVRRKSIDYKSSLTFKSDLDEFISQLQNEGLLFRNITFRKQVIIAKEEIRDYFYSLDNSISIPNKMELVAKWLLAKIRKTERKEREKDWVMDEIELLSKEDFLHVYKELQKQEHIDDSGREEEYLRRKVTARAFAGIKKRVKRLDFVNVLATYRAFFKMWDPKNAPDQWEKICAQTAADLSRKYITWEDAAPYLYVKERLIGEHSDRSVRHLFIDEAQDYTPFQFAYIRHIFPYARMTLLGDVNQAIFTHTMQGSPLIPSNLEEGVEKITLTKSYRSTKQIVEFTKHFAPGGEMIEPFNREGNKPELIELGDQAGIKGQLNRKINELKAAGHETIAIITKTQEKSDTIYDMLKEDLSIVQINEESRSFQKGILVLPVYFAKGIEFDAVIIPDASFVSYHLESDRTLFYTACTRAMHELVLMTDGNKSPFIMESPKDKYDVRAI
ncbi:AAA family ATPase [Virgibacillus dakarensis]|nr:AAA family ATPase [Virgibacillus dakarensis]